MSNINNENVARPYTPHFVVTTKGFVYFIITCAIGALGYFSLKTIINVDNNSYNSVILCTLLSLGLIVIQYLIFAKYTGSFFSYYAIFLIAFVVFHFGLFFVFSIGGTYNFFYLKQYEISFVLDTIMYEFLGTEVLFLAGSWANRIRPFHYITANRIPDDTIFSIAKLFMILTGILAFLLLAYKTKAFLTGYYSGARAFDASVPAILGLIEYFYLPFSILTLIYSQDNQLNKVIEFFVIIWSLVTALCGDRTSGIAGILIIMLINIRFKNSGERLFKKYIASFVTIILVGFLTVYIKFFREGNSFTAYGIMSIISEVFGELGSSFFPLTLIMRVCPSKHSFLYGGSYFYSLIAGFLPSSIDPTGTIAAWNTKAIEPVHWISTDYEYTFGTGYSLCAEAYSNFGWIGFIALFFIGLMIIKLLAFDTDNKFSWYTSAVLMFEFFTLPRRNFYYVINHPSYCIILVTIVLLIFSSKSIRRQ